MIVVTSWCLVSGVAQWEPLEAWIATGKPTWGTCAGMILLANHSEGSKVVSSNAAVLLGRAWGEWWQSWCTVGAGAGTENTRRA